MQLQQIDLNLFVVFDTLYSERSVTRAAERLHITQPAVSNALRRLRDLFGDNLFVRSPEGMTPTPVAESVAGGIRDSLRLLQGSIAKIGKFDPAGSQRNFVISLSDLAQTLLLPRLVDTISRQAPGVTLECVNVARGDIELELGSGRVDIALDVPNPTARQLHQQHLMRDRYVCAISATHPLAGKTLTLDEYLACKHIHLSGRRRGLGHVDIALGRLGLKRNIHLWLRDYTTATAILEGSDLALTLPRRLARHYGLTALELPFVVEALDWCLFWHRSADEEPSNHWLRERVTALFRP
jgi:DNA-binding transcriptional LysR family regulator